METILMSIKPRYVQDIISGIKKYEYRRRIAKNNVSKIIIYETTPVKRVVAEAEVKAVLSCAPEELWNKTKNESGITKEFFDKYFKGKEVANAYHIGKVTVYKEQKMLDEYGVKRVPQSFVYIYQ